MPTSTKLKGINEFTEVTTSENLESNIIEFFNWGLLSIGAFSNVYISQSGVYGGQPYRLRPVLDRTYDSGQVWQGFRSNWVWESGIEYHTQPIIISGVNVNGNFYSLSGNGNYSHFINYRDGQVIFSSGLPINSNVQCEYSYKLVNIFKSDTPWFRQIHFDSMRSDDFRFEQYQSGVWSILSKNRVELPAIVVEVAPRIRYHGYQLGGGQIKEQDVYFHVIADNPYDNKKLLDIITEQNEKIVVGFDKNSIKKEGKFPLDYRGWLNSGALCYPDLVNTYPWKKLIFKDMSTSEIVRDNPLWMSLIKGTVEIFMEEI